VGSSPSDTKRWSSAFDHLKNRCRQSKQEVTFLDPDIYQDSGPGLANEMCCLHEPISGLHSHIVIYERHINVVYSTGIVIISGSLELGSYFLFVGIFVAISPSGDTNVLNFGVRNMSIQTIRL